jgi:hypothetical protein
LEDGWRTNLATLGIIHAAARLAVLRPLACQHRHTRPAAPLTANGNTDADNRYQSAEQLLIHLVRDYSPEAATVRQTSEQLILQALLKHTAPHPRPPLATPTTLHGTHEWWCPRRPQQTTLANAAPTTVLVPGAGLGGLALAIASLPHRAFTVEANELSYVFGSAAVGLWQACLASHTSSTLGTTKATADVGGSAGAASSSSEGFGEGEEEVGGEGGEEGEEEGDADTVEPNPACMALHVFPYISTISNTANSVHRAVQVTVGGSEVWGSHANICRSRSSPTAYMSGGSAGGANTGSRGDGESARSLKNRLARLKMRVGDFDLLYGSGDAAWWSDGGGRSGAGSSDGSRDSSVNGSSSSSNTAWPDGGSKQPGSRTNRDADRHTDSRFGVVVTNFFIDTQHSVIKTMHTIAHNLKPNGLWINYG